MQTPNLHINEIVFMDVNLGQTSSVYCRRDVPPWATEMSRPTFATDIITAKGIIIREFVGKNDTIPYKCCQFSKLFHLKISVRIPVAYLLF
jgi:hypothetical protein